MVTWLPYQQERLARERLLLKENTPGFTIVDPIAEPRVEGRWQSNAGYWYSIRIDIPAGYPEECPSTYIISPKPLLDHRRQPVARWGTSSEGHTWESDRPGNVKICTFRPTFWDARNSLVQVVKKALLWIVAYEQHVFTGKKISQMLSEME